MKTNFLLLLNVLLFTATQLSAQLVLKEQSHLGGMGDDYSPILSVAKNGSVFIGGTSNSNRSKYKSQDSRGGIDYWVIKGVADKKSGAVEKAWDKTIGGSNADFLAAVLATKDNGCLLAGNSKSGISGDKTDSASGNSNYNQDIWLVKLDKTGNIQWQNTIWPSDSDYNANLTGADQLPDGGYILSYGTGGLIRTNAVGNLLWRKPVIASSEDIEYTSVKRTTDGGYIIAANNEVFGHIYLIKTDSSGIMQWNLKTENTFTGEGDLEYSLTTPNAIQTLDGGYALYYSFLVESVSNDGNGYFNNDRYLYKTDKSGKQLWQIHDNNNYHGYYYAAFLSQTTDGQYLFGSSLRSGATVLDLDKIDQHGNKLWQDSVPVNGNAGDMVRITANSYLLSGSELMHANTDSSNDDYYTAVITDTSNTIPAVQQTVAGASIISKPLQNFTVYPNPVRDRLFVQNTGTASFIIKDENGRTVLIKSITNKGEIDVSRLTPGVYYLKNTSTGASQKIVVIK